MDNGEMYRLITEQLNNQMEQLANRMDRIDMTIQRAIDNISIIYKDHDTRIDEHEKNMAIVFDRQSQADAREKKRLVVIGFSIPVISTILNFLWQKIKL